MAGFHLVLNIITTIFVLTTMPSHLASQLSSILLNGSAFASLSCSWIAFLLFLIQIFLAIRQRSAQMASLWEKVEASFWKCSHWRDPHCVWYLQQQNKLAKLGYAIAISKSETVTGSLTDWPTDWHGWVLGDAIASKNHHGWMVHCMKLVGFHGFGNFQMTPPLYIYIYGYGYEWNIQWIWIDVWDLE